jgi:hypothetical protein
MKRLLCFGVALLSLGGTLLADPPVNRIPAKDQKVEEQTVFVTGSLIPKRIRLRPIGTTTVSPVRIIGRQEIDGTGRFTTSGAMINEPALRILGR